MSIIISETLAHPSDLAQILLRNSQARHLVPPGQELLYYGFSKEEC